jgi:uncharacterized protein (DUF488 family)
MGEAAQGQRAEDVPGTVGRIYTIGHSNQPAERLVNALREAGVRLLVDVRRFPMSRRNRQFNHDVLADTLAEAGIAYRHFEALGGRRRSTGPDSPNTALRDEAFRGFADYMAMPAFQTALAELLDLVAVQPAAIMCAEAVPWRCHRSLISDALVARGIEVVHLLGPGERRHELSPHARVVDGVVQYPALL